MRDSLEKVFSIFSLHDTELYPKGKDIHFT